MRACSEHVIRVQRCCVSKKVREAICLVHMQKNNGEIFCQYDLQQTDFGAGQFYYFGASITVFNIFYLMTSKPFPQKRWQSYVVFQRRKG